MRSILGSVVLAALIVSSLVVALPARATTDCKDYEFIAARGTNAAPQGSTTDADYETDQYLGMGQEANIILTKLATKATAAGKTIEPWGVRYPAINDAFNFPALTVEPADYAASVATGGQNVYDRATAVHVACPDTRFILFGYSQGAQAVAHGMSLLGSFVDSYVDAVVFLGDPQFNPTDHTADLSDYLPDHYGLFGHRAKWSTMTDVPVFSYCVSYDMACNSTVKFGSRFAIDAIGVLANGGEIKHGKYWDNPKLLTNAANKVAGTLALSCSSDTTTPTPKVTGPMKLTVGLTYDFSGVGSITNECAPASFAWSSSKNEISNSGFNLRSLDGTPLPTGPAAAASSEALDDPVADDGPFFTRSFDQPGSYSVQTTVTTDDGTETTSVDVDVTAAPTDPPGAFSFSSSTSDGLLTIDWWAADGPTPDYYNILDGDGNVVESLIPAEVSPGQYEWQTPEVSAASGNYSVEAVNAVGSTVGDVDLTATTASYTLQSTGTEGPTGGELAVAGPMNPYLTALEAGGAESLPLAGSYDAELTTESGDSILFDMSASTAHVDLGPDQWQLTMNLSDAVDDGGSSIADQLDAGVAVDLLAGGHLSFWGAPSQLGISIDGTTSSTLVGSHQLTAGTAVYSFVPSTQASSPDVLTLTGPMDPTFERLRNLFGGGPISIDGDYTAQLGGQSLIEFSMDGATANVTLGDDKWTLTMDLSDRVDGTGKPIAESMETGLASQLLAGGDIAVKIAGLTSIFAINGDTAVSQTVALPTAEAVYKHRVASHQGTTGGTLTLKGAMVPHLDALRDSLNDSDPISVAGDYPSTLTPTADVDPISYPMQNADANVTLGETQWQLVLNFGDDVDGAGDSIVDAFEHNFASSLLAGGTVTVDIDGVLTSLTIDSNTVVSQTGDYIIDDDATPPSGISADRYYGDRGDSPYLDAYIDNSYDPTLFPAFGENPSDYDWTQATVTDVRTYIGNQEVSNTGDLSVWWVADPDSEDTTKINWTLAGTIGDNSITTLRAFLQDGTLTFKVNGGATNSTSFHATAAEAEDTYPTPHAPLFTTNLSDEQNWPIYTPGLYFQPSYALDWGVDGTGSFTITGDLPPGTQVTSGWDGPILTGTPTSLGDYTVNVTATNASGTTIHAYTITVEPNAASDRFYLQSYPKRQSNNTYDVHLWSIGTYVYSNNADISTWLPAAQESGIFDGSPSSASFTAQDFTMYKADGTVIPTTGTFSVSISTSPYPGQVGYIDIRSTNATIGDNTPTTVSAIWHQAMKFTFKRSAGGDINTVWAPAFAPNIPIG
ncbi:MAG TPA: cutinase family protein [Pseudolysinimonas sp.]|jgi:hypothetical protein